MKKGIFISLVAMVLVVLVGCGIANKLEGTKWETDDLLGVQVWSFEADGVLKVTTTVTIIEEVTSTVTGTWSADGNELTVDLGAGAGVYEVEIKGDEMNFTLQGQPYLTFTRVN
jgi:ABC-type Zn uptake system ZnuABC Zn-binding protein ZnuA